MRLALLEDDSSFRSQIETIVLRAGHSCHVFETARALIKALRQESFDLLLLDWNLPDMTGVELLGWARESLSECPPVIMVTSRAEQSDVVEALAAGADDYVTKPIQESVLTARIAALLRRSYRPASDSGVETLFGASFDHGHCSVAIAGKATTLTSKEFGLALILFRNMHRAMSRTHLLELVWGRNPDLPTRTLDVHVSRLRSHLGLRPEHGFRLTPVHSFGYRLELVDAVPQAQVA